MAGAAAVLRGAEHAEAVGFRVCESRADLLAELHRVQAAGGEGLMLRSPTVRRYYGGRTSNLLKVKKATP